MKKIATIVGARPQFIKLAPVSRRLRQQFQELLIHTGQHYDHDMAGIFFEELQIPKPDYNLNVGSGSHGRQTGEMLIKIEEVLLQEKPDAVIVYGDTNSTLAGALAASKLHIPLVHIEAGLRSFNKRMPEEQNRILTDHVSDILFAPTETAVQHLKNEGITGRIINVGDVMYDAVKHYQRLAAERYDLDQFNLIENEYILATIHRAENTDDQERLSTIFNSLIDLDQTVVLPLHPRTKSKLKDHDLLSSVEKASNIKMIGPVSYLEMIILVSHARSIITDSGGLQKEAYFLKIPCCTVRDQTEWVETVESGWNILVNPLEEKLDEVMDKFETSSYVDGLYGDGNASGKIVNYLIESL